MLHCSMPGCPALAVARVTNDLDDEVEYACEAHIPVTITNTDTGEQVTFKVHRLTW